MILELNFYSFKKKNKSSKFKNTCVTRLPKFDIKNENPIPHIPEINADQICKKKEKTDVNSQKYLIGTAKYPAQFMGESGFHDTVIIFFVLSKDNFNSSLPCIFYRVSRCTYGSKPQLQRKVLSQELKKFTGNILIISRRGKNFQILRLVKKNLNNKNYYEIKKKKKKTEMNSPQFLYFPSIFQNFSEL